MSDASAIIECVDVSKTYNGGVHNAALSHVTLRVPQGQFIAVMGPSGSGKSTLLNMIAGLDRPTQGEVRVNGMQVSRLGEAALARYRRARLGFVFQFFNLLDHLSVLDNVVLPAQLAGMQTGQANARGREVLAQLGVADIAGAYPARLSGGQRQRVAIARALINHPAVLLADEPTGALDRRSGEQVMETLAQINRDGQTVVMVTHDPRLAASYATRVISLQDGQIVDDAMMDATSAPPAPRLVQVRPEEANS